MELKSKLKISKNVLFREIDDEAVLLNLQSGIYFGLDKVGTEIWRWIGEDGRLDKILDKMTRHYDVAPRTAGPDLLELAGHLKKHGLVDVS